MISHSLFMFLNKLTNLTLILKRIKSCTIHEYYKPAACCIFANIDGLNGRNHAGIKNF